MYFQLVRSFARPYSDNPEGPGVPLVLTYDPLLKPARNTVKQVYEQILSDLDKAYTLQTVYSGSTRFSKYASRALAAKVSLYMGNNTQALAFANDVITNSGFTLATRTNFAAYWANTAGNTATNKTETLFEVSADATLNVGTDELGYIYSQAGYGDLIANEQLYALYSNTDVRKTLITPGPRAGGEAAAFIVTKYKAASGDRDDKKVIRLSEVYLIAAEAAQRLSDPQALVHLNTLMAQRDPSLVYASAGAQLLEDIITERRKELAFEGDRFFDLNRLQRTIARTGGIYAIRNIPYTNDQRWGPIPQSERDANPNISQNPGYN
jgi:starch-binding outer membrane protein, SusD/RagB family